MCWGGCCLEAGRLLPCAEARANRRDAPVGPRLPGSKDIDSDTPIEGARGEGAKRTAVPPGRVTDVVVWTDGYVGDEGAGWAFVAKPKGVVRRGALPACPSHEAEWRA